MIYSVLLTSLVLVKPELSQAGSNLVEQVKGKILLQVEQNGEGWYVNPDNGLRYFLGRPADAFALMRSLGLGITDNDLASIPLAPGYYDPAMIYSSNFGFSFAPASGWIINETNDSMTITIPGYWTPPLEYKLEIAYYTNNETDIEDWLEDYKTGTYSPPFSERDCSISKTTATTQIAYCDFGGVVHFVSNLDGTKILVLGIGQEFPPSMQLFAERISF